MEAPEPPISDVEDDAVTRVSGGSGKDCKRSWSSLISFRFFVIYMCLFGCVFIYVFICVCEGCASIKVCEYMCVFVGLCLCLCLAFLFLFLFFLFFFYISENKKRPFF